MWIHDYKTYFQGSTSRLSLTLSINLPKVSVKKKHICCRMFMYIKCQGLFYGAGRENSARLHHTHDMPKVKFSGCCGGTWIVFRGLHSKIMQYFHTFIFCLNISVFAALWQPWRPRWEMEFHGRRFLQTAVSSQSTNLSNCLLQ